jgi:hypothetical protein
MSERIEALMRIPIGIVAGIIVELLSYPVMLLAICNFFYTLARDERHKGIADFANLWVSYQYRFLRYMTFATNKRGFPFADFEKELEPVDTTKLRY